MNGGLGRVGGWLSWALTLSTEIADNPLESLDHRRVLFFADTLHRSLSHLSVTS
jgi:hypothetical protein